MSTDLSRRGFLAGAVTALGGCAGGAGNPHQIGERAAVIVGGVSALAANILGADGALVALVALGAGGVAYAIGEAAEPECYMVRSLEQVTLDRNSQWEYSQKTGMYIVCKPVSLRDGEGQELLNRAGSVVRDAPSQVAPAQQAPTSSQPINNRRRDSARFIMSEIEEGRFTSSAMSFSQETLDELRHMQAKTTEVVDYDTVLGYTEKNEPIHGIDFGKLHLKDGEKIVITMLQPETPDIRGYDDYIKAVGRTPTPAQTMTP